MNPPRVNCSDSHSKFAGSPDMKRLSRSGDASPAARTRALPNHSSAHTAVATALSA